ncbi:MAG TPA: hypothetical protein VKD47_09600 [Miltoncostaeaceae bacterium]|nr:hypothetical protein [Miltoncostaeaceae bacterium]
MSAPAGSEAVRDARIVIGQVAGLALLWTGACVALATNVVPELSQIAALLLAAGTTPFAVRRIRGTAAPSGRSPVAHVRGGGAPSPALQTEIAGLRRALEAGGAESRRVLREPAAALLASRGVALADHDAARAALGDEAWEALWGEPPRAVDRRQTEEIVEALERLV